MSANRRIGVAAALVLLSTVAASAQPAVDVSRVVEQFYPQRLADLAQRAGNTLKRRQCYAVYDVQPSGAPRTIVAAYTNTSAATIRVLRADASGAFDVIAEPQGLSFAGSTCEVTLVDVDNDGKKDVFVTFAAMMNSSRSRGALARHGPTIRRARFSDFDRFVRSYERDISVSGSRLHSRKATVVDGHRAMRLTYGQRLPGMTPQVVVDFLIGVPQSPGGIAYRFSYLTDVSPAAGQHDDPVYRRMLSSLKILPQR